MASFTEKMQILERWAEHFNNVLNRPSSINNEAISRLPQVEMNEELDDVPSVEEVDKAMMQMSSGKAPGSDAIPAEVYKAAGLIMLQRLTQLFQSVWIAGEAPQQLSQNYIKRHLSTY